MGYVDFAYPRIKETTVNVFFNTDTNKVELLQEYEDDDDCWRAPSETDRFFPTAEEARKAMDEYKHGLIAKMPEIKLYLKSMIEFGRPEDKNDPLYFEYEDYLPWQYEKTHRDDDGYNRKRADRLEKENELLVHALVRRMLSIGADTFHIENVEHIQWGDHKAELHLKDGRNIIAKENWEFNVITYIFGRNISGFTYVRLNEKENQ